MTTEAGFLSAIVADPGDDASRLVYADWLDDHGRAERAEFIRSQIHLAREKEDSLPRRKVARRMRELVDAHEKEWWPIPYAHHGHFVRGLLDVAGVHAEDVSKHGATLFSLAPLTRLWVSQLGGQVERLKEIPPSNTLTSLDLTCGMLTGKRLERLAGLTNLPHLRTLSLQCNRLDNKSVPLLCEHPFFQRLSRVRCGGNPIGKKSRERLRAHFGDRVSFVCEREEDHLYILQESEGGLDPGFGDDDVQMLWVGWEHGVRVVLFDHEGKLLDVRQREVPGRPAAGGWDEAWERKRQQAERAWMKELGFVDATVRFHHFALGGGQGVNDFNWWTEAFDKWDHPQAEVRDCVEEWLLDGQWEWSYGDGNFWVDGNGEVTDT